MFFCISYVNASQETSCSMISDLMHQLDVYYKQWTISSDECHMKTHMLTRELVGNCGVTKVQEDISHHCRNAMVHGIMEGYALILSWSDDLIDRWLDHCKSYYDLSSLVYSECVHGIWNWLILSQDLDIEPAISACESIETLLDRNYCVTGVYGWLFRYDKVSKEAERCMNKPYEGICRNYIGKYFDGANHTENSRCSEAKVYDKDCRFGLGVMQSRAYDNDVSIIADVCMSDTCLEWALREAKRVDAAYATWRLWWKLLW